MKKMVIYTKNVLRSLKTVNKDHVLERSVGKTARAVFSFSGVFASSCLKDFRSKHSIIIVVSINSD